MDNVDAVQFEPGVVASLWRYRWLSLLFVFGFGVLGFASAYLQPSESSWTASSVLVVQDPRSSALFDRTNQPQGRYVANQVAILRSTDVAQEASDILAARGVDIPPEGVLTKSEVIAASNASEVIEIVFRADSEVAAIEGANAIAEAYQVVRRAEARSNYQSSLDQLDAFIAATDARLVEIEAEFDAERTTGDEATLQALYDDAVARLLQVDTSNATPEALEAVRAEIDVIQQALTFSRTENGVNTLGQEQQILLSRRSRLTETRDEIAIDSELLGSGVLLDSQATSANAPASTSPARNSALGLVFGAAFGAIASYFLALRRRTFSDANQPALVLSAPLLASIPHFKEERVGSELPLRTAPASEAAESFRFAAGAIKLRFDGPARYPDGSVAAGPGSQTPWVAFISASAGDGKTVVTANTALAVADDGKRILLIDADAAEKGLGKLLEDAAVSSTELVLPSGLKVGARVIEGAHSGEVHLVSLGDVGRGETGRIVSDRLQVILGAAMTGEYDFVFVDVPPLLQIAYANTIVNQIGTAVAVVPHGGRVTKMEEARDRLELSATTVVGYVYNMAPLRSDAAGAGSSLQAHRSSLRADAESGDWSDIVEIGRDVKAQHDAASGG